MSAAGAETARRRATFHLLTLAEKDFNTVFALFSAFFRACRYSLAYTRKIRGSVSPFSHVPNGSVASVAMTCESVIYDL